MRLQQGGHLAAVALTFVCAYGVATSAQNTSAPAVPRTADGKTNLTAPSPKAAAGAASSASPVTVPAM